MGLSENDDIFKDALPDFMSLSDIGIYSPNIDVGHCETMVDMSDPSLFESAEAFSHEKDLGKGKGISGEIYYEAEGSDNLDFVSVTFSTRSSGSPGYDGVDTQVSELNILDFESGLDNISL